MSLSQLGRGGVKPPLLPAGICWPDLLKGDKMASREFYKKDKR